MYDYIYIYRCLGLPDQTCPERQSGCPQASLQKIWDGAVWAAGSGTGNLQILASAPGGGSGHWPLHLAPGRSGHRHLSLLASAPGGSGHWHLSLLASAFASGHLSLLASAFASGHLSLLASASVSGHLSLLASASVPGHLSLVDSASESGHLSLLDSAGPWRAPLAVHEPSGLPHELW